MKPARVNDVHSQLNQTDVKKVVVVESVDELRDILKVASHNETVLCVSGGKHSMGSQQFATGGILIDMSKMNRVLNFDTDKGLIEVEAGIQWPELISHYLDVQKGKTKQWGIAQKQTGADRFSIGGTISSNSHGRGLSMKPIIANIESLVILNHKNELIKCSREENNDLFRLVIGGYGLFGIIVSVILRLVPRQKIQRIVEVVDIESLTTLFEQRIKIGHLYGDFQFSIDESSNDFLRKGVFSTYGPVSNDAEIAENKNELSKDDWNNLVLLAHTDKSRAFDLYAKHYLSTSGQIYWSDTHQLSIYLDKYHDFVNEKLDNNEKGTEIITEIYVPRNTLLPFIEKVGEYFRTNKVNLIYGTIRLIEKDEESFLAWAKEPWICIVFNLHTQHTADGIEHSAKAFRYLIDLSMTFGGTYSLTYHKFATKEQVKSCYPQFQKFLELKRQHDPEETFQSDWYRHYKKLFS